MSGRLEPGDEVLTTDHEYGALNRTWEYMCRSAGAAYVRVPVALPLTGAEPFVERFFDHVTERTRVIFLSHITSPTALIFPVAEVCRRAREQGIVTIIDGAHAPGQILLDLAQVNADIYVGACHKWLSAPKGAAFLQARREIQPWLEPLVISWGWESESPRPSDFVAWHEWQGTRDISAFLAVPDAIRFQHEYGWTRVQQACHALAVACREEILGITDLPSVSGENAFAQMFAAELPPCDPRELKARLIEEHRVEVPIVQWGGRLFVRVSFQAYNDWQDAEALCGALRVLLPAVARAVG